MPIRLISFLLALTMQCVAADGTKSKTTHAEAYGATQNAVTVDPAKDLPRYPAVEPREAVATWQVKKGFKLELVTHEPLVRDPIAICFDERGRIFVCEMIDYSEMRDVTPHLGRISMLEDKDGDGFFETSQVFADNLPWPTGLIWANGGLYVGATPDIWRFEDKDGDGRAEVREKIYSGFGTGLKILNVQGLLNSFQWGQDNRVHVLAGGGNRGKITCLKRPDLPEQELGGKDFWFDPLTHEFGLEAGGAQYGMSFDNYGRKFGCSNSDHLQYWLYDDRYAARNPYYDMPPPRRGIAADGGAAEVFRISPDEPWRIIRTRWRIAGVVKGTVEGGGRVSGYFTGATGTTIYRGDAYGAEFVNNSFTGDAGGQLIHRKIIGYADNGIDLIGQRPTDEKGYEFAASKDTWVRVVNFANAPDGCLYVCDMYREVIEHPWSVPDEIKQHLDLKSGNDRGRIWRIVPQQGAKRIGQKVTLANAGIDELVNLLGHANGWHRDTAQRLLYEKQDKGAVSLLKARLKDGSTALHQIHALNALASLKAVDVEVVTRALVNQDPQVREKAVLLGSQMKGEPQVKEAVQKLGADVSPRLRFIYAMLLPQFFGDSTTLAARQLGLIETNPDNPLMLAAVLGSKGTRPQQILESMVNKQSAALNGPVIEALLRMIGHQKESQALKYAIILLTSDALPAAKVQIGIKAFAIGLGRAGTSIAKVDAEGKLSAVFTKAATRASDPETEESKRVEAIELLALATKEQAQTTLAACLSANQSERVQTAAVKALDQVVGKDASAWLLRGWKDLKPKARVSTLAILLARDEGALILLEAMGSSISEVPKAQDFAASQVQDLIKHKNAKVAALAKMVLAPIIPPSREEMVKKFQPALTLKGDVVAGEQMFLSRCLACHVADGQGIEVGPNLVTVKTKGRDGLLTAILEPHKEVASQYIAYTVNTKDGQTIQGIIAKDDANSMTLKMMGGAEVTVQRVSIQGSSSTGQSLMPEGLEQGMSEQDMADLLSFIEATK